MSICKAQVKHNFAKAAADYQQYAGLQAYTGAQLHRNLPSVSHLAQGVVLDLGCGPGHQAKALAMLYPQYPCIGMDVAPAMLEYARRHEAAENLCWLAADAEHLPFAKEVLTLIYSNLMLQWCEDLQASLQGLQQASCQGASLHFSTLVTGTCPQISQVWQACQRVPQVRQFLTRKQVQTQTQQAGWHIQACQQEEVILHFETFTEVLASLRKVGAHTPQQPTKHKGLQGRGHWQALQAEYEKYRGAQGLPLSYQVLYIHAVKT
ncbi:malonyl-CoA O-methyltransferase [Allopseudospirillum japonicum]|uniref:Malonyl-[acyl-carrier protein] O-methyltransferase n=1 Tax=Allopseudospirillum japonicum TaxID=64971 RepID=A0A1H6QGC3_9GAMM|nr:malonyl-ACP O-methyltransferase BioC [Allopseudospirillum japonicum]SEI40926.1 malonyl-CoA O-methyltransferase [Allopseudospirillum japonicum]